MTGEREPVLRWYRIKFHGIIDVAATTTKEEDAKAWAIHRFNCGAIQRNRDMVEIANLEYTVDDAILDGQAEPPAARKGEDRS